MDAGVRGQTRIGTLLNLGSVELTGATARELIARRNVVGRVLAVVTGTVYLSVIARSEATKQSPTSDWGIASQKPVAMTKEEVLWLAQNHLPMHPRAIRGKFDFDAIQVGMIFELGGIQLRFANDAAMRFADSQVWQPSTIDPARVVPIEVVMARVREIQNPKSFRKPFGSLRELVGLGEGLTPSGDDFIGGLLFAQWHLHKAFPNITKWDQLAIDDLIEYARARTNVISHAILRDHANGQSIEPMHSIIAGLLYGESFDVIMPHVHKLLAIGNTSGQEVLAGMLSFDAAKLPR